MIKYGSYSSKSITVAGIGYHFSTLHICSIRGNKQLAFDESTNTMKLSLDNGLTYPYTLNLTGVCDQIKRSKIYANGNIMWANDQNCYYSTDNLATYHTSTVLGIDGLTFVPSTYDNFKQLIHDEEILINAVQIDVWGCYSIETDTQYANMNVWYTIDSGITIKSCFKYGVTLGGQKFRHVHSVNYCPIDGSFWMRVGDAQDLASGATQFLNNFWNRGFYNWGTDSWTWENRVTGGSNYPPAGVGFVTVNGNVFWGTECTTGSGGVWKAAYSDFMSSTWGAYDLPVPNQIQKFSDVDQGIVGLYKNSNVIIATDYQVKCLHISVDYGETWTKYTLIGGPALMSGLGAYHCCIGPDQNGYFKFEIVAASDVNYRDFTKGTVLMLRVK
jgi:hypothetical protein